MAGDEKNESYGELEKLGNKPNPRPIKPTLNHTVLWSSGAKTSHNSQDQKV